MTHVTRENVAKHGVAHVREVFEVQRFTRQEYERGKTVSWDLYGGWYQRMGGLVWAWFRRDVEEGEQDGSD